MMYTMPKNLLSICVNFALATQPAKNYGKAFIFSAIMTQAIGNLLIAN